MTTAWVRHLGVGLLSMGLGAQTTWVAAQSIDLRQVEARANSPCSALLGRGDSSFSIVSARRVEADSGADPVPAHCRVDGYIPPAIRFQVNLPEEWNGRLVVHGNGGYAGDDPAGPGAARDRDAALRDRFATAKTDTGHDAEVEPLATFAHDDRAAELDYAYRAIHLTTTTAKALIESHYAEPPRRSYFVGCSTGGRQGLMSAQRFPADFDGIVAGAPVLDFTGTQIWGLWNSTAVRANPIDFDDLEIVGEAVYEQCDAIDGLEDALIEDPRLCEFDVDVHVPTCSGERSDGERCLSRAAKTTFRKIYGGVQSRGEILFPGQPVGAELGDRRGLPPGTIRAEAPFSRSGWALWYVHPRAGRASIQETLALSFMRYLAFPVDRPEFEIGDLDFDQHPHEMSGIRRILDATDPDLSEFRRRGGKMITYHGWADTALNPLMAVEYYEQAAELQPELADTYRLFMVPGMFHCRGGLGVTSVSPLEPLVEWVEADVAPDRLLGERRGESGAVEMSRPLCPYPQRAVYRGEGDPNRAGSFDCRAP